MRTLSDLDQLISDIKSVLNMDPPPPRVQEHGGAVVTAQLLRSIGVTADQLRDACAAAGLTFRQRHYDAYAYIIGKQTDQ